MDSLDLHNTRYDEVGLKWEHFVYPHLQRGTTEVTVITGNSKGMKDALSKVLEDYGMTYNPVWGNNGAVTVKLK
jgi:hypothetical protein